MCGSSVGHSLLLVLASAASVTVSRLQLLEDMNSSSSSNTEDSSSNNSTEPHHHHHHHHHNSHSSHHPNSVYSEFAKYSGQSLQVFYQTGSSESDLPVCSPYSVCGKLDTYGTPWLERQCRCPQSACSESLQPRDGHTIHDRTKQYKLCEPVKKLKKCKFFRDVTWTSIIYPDNTTQQVMHCRCPKNAVAYLVKRQAYQTETGSLGYQFSFACSPQTKLRCERKEPCRLFSVKKSPARPEVDEVTMSGLCSCPHGHRCPKHHLDVGVVPGRVYTDDAVRTYSGYCM